LEEGADKVVTDCHELKLPAADGKSYRTDCANIETMFRVIQSIPSKKAEPFKQWLAKVGFERIRETAEASRKGIEDQTKRSIITKGRELPKVADQKT
jgi:hypothetical protein